MEFQNLVELEFEYIESHSSYLCSTSSTARWKTAHQPPEASASSYDLSHGLDRRVARIILTASSLALLFCEEMESSQKMNCPRTRFGLGFFLHNGHEGFRFATFWKL